MQGYKRRKMGNDMNKLMALYGHMIKPGGHVEHIIHHDSWCRHFKGKPCNCDPDIIFNPSAAQIDDTLKSPDHSFQLWAVKPTTIH